MEERNDMVDLRLLSPTRAAGNGAHRPLLDQGLPKISGNLVCRRFCIDGSAGSGISEDPLDALRTASDVAGHLGWYRGAVGKGTGQVRVFGEREERNGHDGGGLMRQPPPAGWHTQLDEILKWSGVFLVVGTESRASGLSGNGGIFGTSGLALRVTSIGRLCGVVSWARIDLLCEVNKTIVGVHVRD